MKSVRVDKWLWSVRAFKSRTLAQKACEGGKVSINDRKVKPADKCEIGDIVVFSRARIKYKYRIVNLLEKRVGAEQAKDFYADISPEEFKKVNQKILGNLKKIPEFREPGLGRPTKKERRDIDRLKGKSND